MKRNRKTSEWRWAKTGNDLPAPGDVVMVQRTDSKRCWPLKLAPDANGWRYPDDDSPTSYWPDLWRPITRDERARIVADMRKTARRAAAKAAARIARLMAQEVSA